MSRTQTLALLSAAALACLVPATAQAAPGYITCQIYDGDRNRVFYTAQPAAADSELVDNAYEYYLKQVQQGGLLGNVNKAQGNCNWERSRDAAANKQAAFVKHFVSAGANPFNDRYIRDTYVYQPMGSGSAPPAPKAPTPVAPVSSAAPVVTLSEGKGGKCRVEVRSDMGHAEAEMERKDGRISMLQYVMVPDTMLAPGQGPAKGGRVAVHFEITVTNRGDVVDFNGLGTRLTFPEHTVTGPIDVRLTIGDQVYAVKALERSSNGTYELLSGRGSFKTSALLAAIDKAKVIEVLASVSGTPNQAVVYADIPIGTPDQRDALTQATLDAIEKQGKKSC
jgi:hypothetical protein